ncbi:MAG: hypothetical protein HZB26_02925 [Candidatus Hydrogenedentes bacterium]|nr:hypothetical protein [Candidatus Hydrogenedentota bacterium]
MTAGLGLASWGLVRLWSSFTPERIDVEYELNKIRAAGLPATAEELNAWYPTPPDDQNAAIPLQKAFEAFRDVTDASSPVFGQLPQLNEELTPEVKAAALEHVARNGKCLEFIHQATEREHCRLPFQLPADIDVNLAHVESFAKCGNLLALKCLLAAEEHDCDGAFAALNDEIRLAHTLCKEPSFMSQLFRAGLHDMFRQSLEMALNRCPLSEAQLARLQDAVVLETDSEMMFKVLVAERCIDPSATMDRTPDSKDDSPRPGGSAERLMRYKYLVYMGRLVDASRLPPFERIRAIKQVADDLNPDDSIVSQLFHTSDMWVSFLILPTYISLFSDQDRYTARTTLEQAALAVERYRLKRGRAPSSLSELVPEFLDAVPTDPFTMKPLSYEVHGQGYTLHSRAEYPQNVEMPKGTRKLSKLGEQLSVTVNR